MFVPRSYAIRLTICGMLVALSVVLGGLLKVPVSLFGVYALKISFGMIPVLIVAFLYGPLYGAMCGALADLLQALLFPAGAFNPLFTIVGGLLGLLPALFFMRNRHFTFLRILLSVFVSQAFCSVVLNTLIISLVYGLNPAVLLPPRALTQAIVIPIFSVISYALLKVISTQHRLGMREYTIS